MRWEGAGRSQLDMNGTVFDMQGGVLKREGNGPSFELRDEEVRALSSRHSRIFVQFFGTVLLPIARCLSLLLQE